MHRSKASKKFIPICEKLRDGCDQLKFSDQLLTIYNPLQYAWQSFSEYISTCLKDESSNLLLGMNPGPFGMAQTGVPFGDVVLVRDFMGIEEKVEQPSKVHPKRPIDGFDCKRREVSGSRLWGWAKEDFITKDNFFSKYFVWNYCPLVFMEEGGANRTPDKLSIEEREALFAYCDRALIELIKVGQFERLIGVGKFARKRLEKVAEKGVLVGDILHPSPASPKANKDWIGQVRMSLKELGAPVS